MDNVKLIDWIEQELKQRNWSIRELSRASGVHSTALSRILSGQKKLTLDIYIKLAEGFDVPVERLLRLAGILSEGDGDPSLAEWVEAGKRLSPEERLQILDYADYMSKKRG